MYIHLNLIDFFSQQLDLIHEDIIFCYPNNIYDPSLAHTIFLKNQSRIESIINIVNQITIVSSEFSEKNDCPENFIQFIKKEFLLMNEHITQSYHNNYFNADFANTALFNIQAHLNSTSYFLTLFKDNLFSVDYQLDLPYCLSKQYHLFYTDYYYAYPHDSLDPLLAHFSCSCFYSRLSVIDSLLSSSIFPNLNIPNIEQCLHLLKTFKEDNQQMHFTVNKAYPNHFYDPSLVHDVCSSFIQHIEDKISDLQSLFDNRTHQNDNTLIATEQELSIKKYNFKQLL